MNMNSIRLTSQPSSHAILEISFSLWRSARILSIFFDVCKDLVVWTFLRLTGTFTLAPPLLDSSALELDGWLWIGVIGWDLLQCPISQSPRCNQRGGEKNLPILDWREVERRPSGTGETGTPQRIAPFFIVLFSVTRFLLLLTFFQIHWDITAHEYTSSK